MNNCKHMSVWIETKVVSHATYDFPEETMSRAVCKECGEIMDIEEIPEGAEEEEREYGRGLLVWMVDYD
jgi:hypothetical protein